MPDKFICDTCGEELPSSRGLAIHAGRVHKGEETKPRYEPHEPALTPDLERTKDKFASIVSRARPSTLINIPLRGMARTYGDSTIPLTPSEASDLDGVIQELLSEVGGDAKTISKIGPYLPWLSAAFIAGPILLDKWEKIQAARAGAPAEPKGEPTPSAAGKPTLKRKDVQPDGGGE